MHRTATPLCQLSALYPLAVLLNLIILKSEMQPVSGISNWSCDCHKVDGASLNGALFDDFNISSQVLSFGSLHNEEWKARLVVYSRKEKDSGALS